MEMSEIRERREDIRKRRLELEDELADLEEAESALRAESDTAKIAIALHEKMCRYNNTDGCGWLYEIKGNTHNWDGNAHASWFRRAEAFERKIPAKYTTEDVLAILHAL